MLRKHIAEFDHIIWDWNGTLLADLDLIHDLITEQLNEDGIPVPTREEYLHRFCFPIRTYYESLGYDFNKVPYEHVSARFLRRYYDRLHEAELFPGTHELLAENLLAGKTQSVLSATEQSSLDRVVDRYGVRKYFQYVYGIEDSLGHGKVGRGMELAQHAQIDRERTLLIGDTDHDLDVGKAMGVHVLLVADGHQSFERIQRAHHRVLRSRFPVEGAK